MGADEERKGVGEGGERVRRMRWGWGSVGSREWGMGNGEWEDGEMGSCT